MIADADKRIAELQARSAARAKAREAEQPARAKSEQIADLERLDRLEAAVEASGLEVGRTLLVVHAAYPDGRIVESIALRAPSGVAWKSFRRALEDVVAKRAKPEVQEVAGDRLWRACLVSPDEAAVSALVDRFPGLPDLMTDAITKLAGYRAEEVGRQP